MRKWGWGHAPSTESRTDVADDTRQAAWDGLRGRSGASVVIQAARAGDAVEHRQVA
jgi:hypothetical protein